MPKKGNALLEVGAFGGFDLHTNIPKAGKNGTETLEQLLLGPA